MVHILKKITCIDIGYLQFVCMCVFSCLVMSLCDSVDFSLPGSSVHGIFPARILEWVEIMYILKGEKAFYFES